MGVSLLWACNGLESFCNRNANEQTTQNVGQTNLWKDATGAHWTIVARQGLRPGALKSNRRNQQTVPQGSCQTSLETIKSVAPKRYLYCVTCCLWVFFSHGEACRAKLHSQTRICKSIFDFAKTLQIHSAHILSCKMVNARICRAECDREV